MKKLLFGAISLVVLMGGGHPAAAVSLDEACARFAAKIAEAQASGSPDNAKKVYSKGSQRIASKFNGSTCPNVKAP